MAGAVMRSTADTPLSIDELDGLEYHGCSSGTTTQPMVRDMIVRATRELRALRAAKAADRERVRGVVREAIVGIAVSQFCGYFVRDDVNHRDVESIANRVADALAVPPTHAVEPQTTLPVFDAERRQHVDCVALRGGEVPLPDLVTPEQLADHVRRMVCAFWNWPGNPYSNAELVHRIALGALRRMRELSSLLAASAGDEALIRLGYMVAKDNAKIVNDDVGEYCLDWQIADEELESVIKEHSNQ